MPASTTGLKERDEGCALMCAPRRLIPAVTDRWHPVPSQVAFAGWAADG